MYTYTTIPVGSYRYVSGMIPNHTYNNICCCNRFYDFHHNAPHFVLLLNQYHRIKNGRFIIWKKWGAISQDRYVDST